MQSSNDEASTTDSTCVNDLDQDGNDC
jgi:hypothetical protein